MPGNAIPRLGWARNIHVDIVRHPVLGLEQLERVELRAGLVSEQFDLQLIGLVRRPETLDLKARAIFKADKAAGIIVRSVLLVRALRHLPKTPIAPAARAELRAAHPCHCNGLGHAEQVPHRVEHMHAHIPERAPALLDKPEIPRGNATSAHTARTGVVQIAKITLACEIAQVLAPIGKPGRKRHHIDHARGLGDLHELLCRLLGIRQGLGHHHMLVIANHLERDRHMPLIGRAHKNRVNLWILAHGFVIGVKPLLSGQLAGELRHPLWQQIAQRHDLASRIRGKGAAIGLANAHSHDARTYFLIWHPALLLLNVLDDKNSRPIMHKTRRVTNRILGKGRTPKPRRTSLIRRCAVGVYR